MGAVVDDVAFANGAFCDERGIDPHPTINAPTKRLFNAFQTGIASLRFNSPAVSESTRGEPKTKRYSVALG
jgi:hypothetical protein